MGEAATKGLDVRFCCWSEPQIKGGQDSEVKGTHEACDQLA